MANDRKFDDHALDRDRVRLLPEQRVGAAMRAARESAGLSLRETARRLNYASHSVLSEYENGARMPSESVVAGYERLLGLMPTTLTTILEGANMERHGDAWAMRRFHLPSPAGPARESIPSTPAAAASPWPLRPIADGVDPDEAGCSADALTAHSRRLAITGQRKIIGQIELRYSPSGRAAWGRFQGYPLLDHLARQRRSVDVLIEVIRDRDGACIGWQQQYAFDKQWGNLVTTDGGLFFARATVLFDDEIVAHGESDRRALA